jgi:excisionase family DNA binding protein
MSDLLNTEALEEIIRQVARDEIERVKRADGHPGRLLTPKEVADLWGCHERTVTRQLLDGSLPGVRIGRSWRVRPEDAAR